MQNPGRLDGVAERILGEENEQVSVPTLWDLLTGVQSTQRQNARGGNKSDGLKRMPLWTSGRNANNPPRVRLGYLLPPDESGDFNKCFNDLSSRAEGETLLYSPC